uniref:DUF1385 domain-containing protein n=1 Tax=uncultured bacterium W5-102b TaxID=1130996 RepID=H9BWJ1_9BACT|nr:hypothetical protein [uncultured bacterium W5-102b]
MRRLGWLVLHSANASVGGQAVMEGVMMRTPHHWSVALRRYNGDIVEIHREITPYAERHRWARLPIMRGVVALGESLVVGFRALGVSAHYAAEWYDPELEQDLDDDEAADKPSGDAEADADADAGGEPRDNATAAAETAAAETADNTDEQQDAEVVQLDDHRTAAADEDTEDGAHVVTPAETDDPDSDASPESLSRWQIGLSFVLAIGLSIGLFKLLPLALTKGFIVDESQTVWFVLAEGVIRISIFCLYLFAVGFIPDLKRVFQYHSAEHKSINAFERGHKLEPAIVNQESRIHVRCGTAFLLWVFVVAIVVFGIYGYLRDDPSLAELVLSRIVFLPLIAGVSFELIKFAGKYPDNRFLRGVLAPGLWLQYLTTRPCEDDQCEIAIASLNIVLDAEKASHPPKDQASASDDDDEVIEVLA